MISLLFMVWFRRGYRAFGGLHRVLANVIVYLRDDGAFLRRVWPVKEQLI